MPQAKVIPLKHEAKEGTAFREVLFTGEKSQLVIMSLRPREDIGDETHGDVDQMLYVVKGAGVAVIDGVEQPLETGAIFCVPKGTRHNVKNTGTEPLKLFTVYAPPQHAPGTIHATKADAQKAEHAEPAIA